MKDPLISVIVPVYKVEQYLDRCLQSIVNQTYKNLEIILVDDGSPDNCPEICDEWMNKDKRISVIHQENGGLSNARNTGLRIASGEYIGFVDSDDWIELDMYEYLLDMMLQLDADISHCSFYKTDGSISFEGHGTNQEYIGDNFFSMREALLLEKFILSVWNKLYKRNVLEGVFFEDGRYYEDTLFNFYAFKNANKTVYKGVPKYHYFTRMDSIVESSFSKRNFDVIYSTDQLCKLTNKYYPELIDYAERRDVIENILMLNSIITSTNSTSFEKDYQIIVKKLRSYSKKANKNKLLHNKYKLLLLTLIFNEGLFVYLLTSFLSRKKGNK